MLTCRRNNFLFKYLLVLQRKINKIPESMGFLLEAAGCQQPPAIGASMVRGKDLSFILVKHVLATQILQRIFNQNNAGAWQKAHKGPIMLPKHLYSGICNTIPFVVSGMQGAVTEKALIKPNCLSYNELSSRSHVKHLKYKELYFQKLYWGFILN